jgi:hypothetical protein
MKTIDRHTFPPGGWQFRQPQSGWSAPAPTSNTFDQTVVAIIKHRTKNPAMVAKNKLSTDFNEVANELETFNRLRLGIPLETAPSFFQTSSSQLQSRVVAAAVHVKRAAQGTAVVLDWLTSGGQPVSQELAEQRGKICVACPKNVVGEWYTTAPAELIRSTLSARSDLKLQTSNDEKLQSCDVCKCLMRLKVWTPLEFIVNKTRPEIMEEFPSHCWIARRDQ